MKFATIVLMGIMLLGSPAAFSAGDPAGASEVAIGFNGGSTWTSGSTGICIWSFPVLGDLNLGSLYATGSSGAPVVDRAHSYLIWVSDFSVEALPPTGGANPNLYLFLAPAGEATIYFNPNPGSRDFTNLLDRSTWGEPVAVFTREASLVRSSDGLLTDTFIFSAKLVSSETVSLNGKHFNFRDLIPHGMTCFETGYEGSSWEAGSCIAIGGGLFGR